jgi:hypothetical protein
MGGLPAGERLVCVAHYGNGSKSPQDQHWGFSPRHVLPQAWHVGTVLPSWAVTLTIGTARRDLLEAEGRDGRGARTSTRLAFSRDIPA